MLNGVAGELMDLVFFFARLWFDEELLELVFEDVFLGGVGRGGSEKDTLRFSWLRCVFNADFGLEPEPSDMLLRSNFSSQFFRCLVTIGL